MDGFLVFDQTITLLQIQLNWADPLAKELARGLAALVALEQVALSLGETKE